MHTRIIPVDNSSFGMAMPNAECIWRWSSDQMDPMPNGTTLDTVFSIRRNLQDPPPPKLAPPLALPLGDFHPPVVAISRPAVFGSRP